jgi:ABC-type dipeptide/oligopeptide/nickel transport system permease component
MSDGVSMTERPAGGLLERVAGTVLLGLMVLGGFVLWIGIPIAVLWAAGKAADSISEHYLIALLAVPSAMLLFAFVLVWINTLYLRVTGLGTPQDEEDFRPRLRGPLDRILAVCAVFALILVLGWVLFGGQHPGGGTVW